MNLTPELSFNKFSYDDWIRNDVENYNASYGSLDKEEYDCPICRNKGYIAKTVQTENGLERRVVKCECLRKRERYKSKEDLDLCCDGATLEAYKATEPWQQDVLKKADMYVNYGDGHFFFVGGQIGCGKTHICTGICRKLMDTQRVKVMFWSYELDKLKSFDEESYLAKINAYLSPDVLYIDDFLKRKIQGGGISDADRNIAYDIINGRYVQKKRTVISSEFDIQQVMEMLQDVGSRIYQMSMPDYCISIGKDAAKNYRLRRTANV